jgi:hypothetical protein
MPIQNESDARVARMQKMAAKERILTRYLSTVGGLNKIAANLANPVRRKLDYKGIMRKFFVVELMEAGIPLIFDRDLPEVPCVKVAQSGTVNSVEMYAERVEVQDFEIAGRPKIPYRELYVRRFRALDRAKDRLIEGMQLREDLTGLSLMAAAITANAALPASMNPPTPTNNSTEGFTREGLRKCFAEIEDNRLIVGSVLMSAFGTAGIRGWQFTELDQVGMQEVRESGYLGRMWGADFFVTDQIADGTAYVLAQDKFLGWWPIRKDTDVIPADDPDNLRLGFVGYELIGMFIHNSLAVNSITFTSTGPVWSTYNAA